MTANENWNIELDDQSLNVKLTVSEATAFVGSVRNGQWGTAQFGSTLILGAGYNSTYTTEGLYGGTRDDRLNVLGS